MMAQPSSPSQPRKRSIVVTDPPKFDLESYIQNYKGRTRFDRLVLIGTSSTFLGVEALKAAVIETKNGKDVKRYLEAVAHLQIVGPEEPESVRDQEWVDTVEKQNAIETQRLEAQLKGYKNNLIKESIRMGNEDLGKHYQSIGDLPHALEAFSRMRQDISLSKHVVDVNMHLIEVAVEQRNWIVVSASVQKIRGITPQPDEEEKKIQPYTAAAEGLAQMDMRDYQLAALSFLSTDAGMPTAICNTIISPNDIAVYGGLCALASMDRNELQSRVLDNSNFRTYLELEPHIRRAITFFVSGRYSSCLAILEAYRTDYLLDIHLQRHVDDLYHLVRSKSIVQYFIPFSCVTLDSLNAAFSPAGKTIDKELVQMIQRHELDARIDTKNRLLNSVPYRPRINLQRETLATAKEFEREARRRIRHMNISAMDLDIKGGKKVGASFGAQLPSIEDFYGEGGNLMQRSNMRGFNPLNY